VADFSASLGPLGEATGFSQTAAEPRGGMMFRAFRIATPGKGLNLSTYVAPDGRFAQFLISPAAQ